MVGSRRPLTEPLILLVAGGLGAGYILWEFAHDDGRIVTLGFTNSSHYFDRRLATTFDRLGLDGRLVADLGGGGRGGGLRRELGAGSR